MTSQAQLYFSDAFELFIDYPGHPFHEACLLCIPVSGVWRANTHSIPTPIKLLHPDHTEQGSTFTMSQLFQLANFFLGGRSIPNSEDLPPSVTVLQFKAWTWSQQGKRELSRDELDGPICTGRFFIQVPQERQGTQDLYFAEFMKIVHDLIKNERGGEKATRPKNFPDMVIESYGESAVCVLTGSSIVHCAHIIDNRYAPICEILASFLGMEEKAYADIVKSHDVTSGVGVADIRCPFQPHFGSTLVQHPANGIHLTPTIHAGFDRGLWFSLGFGETANWLDNEPDALWVATALKLHYDSQSEPATRLSAPPHVAQIKTTTNHVLPRNIAFSLKTLFTFIHRYCPANTRHEIIKFAQDNESLEKAKESAASKGTKRGASTQSTKSPKRLKQGNSSGPRATKNSQQSRARENCAQMVPSEHYRKKPISPPILIPSKSDDVLYKSTQVVEVPAVEEPIPTVQSDGVIYDQPRAEKSPSLSPSPMPPNPRNSEVTHVDASLQGPNVNTMGLPPYIMTQERADEIEGYGQSRSEPRISAFPSSPTGSFIMGTPKHTTNTLNDKCGDIPYLSSATEPAYIDEESSEEEEEKESEEEEKEGEDSEVDRQKLKLELHTLWFLVDQHRQSAKAPPYTMKQLNDFASLLGDAL